MFAHASYSVLKSVDRLMDLEKILCSAAWNRNAVVG